MKKLLLCLLTLSLFTPACGFKKVATKTSSQIFYDASSTVDSEQDVELAQQASAGFLKMLEGFYVQNPKDKLTLLLLARSYAGYAYGFTENDILANKGSNKARYDKAMARAKLFYERAKRYGNELLVLLPGMSNANEASLDEFEASLQRLGESQIENLFWIGFAWGNYLNFHKDSVAAIAEIPKLEALMRRVLTINESYYYGGAHLFLGAFYGSRPKLLGGNPELARKHFEKAIQITDGKNLMALVTMAQYYAVQVQDAKLYNRLLRQVLAADASALPEIRLMNELAKIRAKILLNKKSQYFSS